MAKFNIAFELDAVHIDCHLEMSFSLSEAVIEVMISIYNPYGKSEAFFFQR